MKSQARIITGAVILIGWVVAAQCAEEAAKTEIVQFSGTDVRTAFDAVVKQKRISYIMRDDVKGTITGSFDLGSPDAFKKMAEAAGCVVDEFEKTGFLVVHGKDWKLWGPLKEELDALPDPKTRQADKPRKLVFQGAPFRDIFDALAKSVGKELVISDNAMENIKGSVTARMLDVPVLTAMKILLGLNECSLVERDGKLVVEKGKMLIEGGGENQ